MEEEPKEEQQQEVSRKTKVAVDRSLERRPRRDEAVPPVRVLEEILPAVMMGPPREEEAVEETTCIRVRGEEAPVRDDPTLEEEETATAKEAEGVTALPTAPMVELLVVATTTTKIRTPPWVLAIIIPWEKLLPLPMPEVAASPTNYKHHPWNKDPPPEKLGLPPAAVMEGEVFRPIPPRRTLPSLPDVPPTDPSPTMTLRIHFVVADRRNDKQA